MSRTHSPWVDMYLHRSQTLETLAFKREMSKSGTNIGLITAVSRLNESVEGDVNRQALNSSGPETPVAIRKSVPQASKLESSINHLTDSQLELLLEHVLQIKEEEKAKNHSVRYHPHCILMAMNAFNLLCRQWIMACPEPRQCNGHLQISLNHDCPPEAYDAMIGVPGGITSGLSCHGCCGPGT